MKTKIKIRKLRFENLELRRMLATITGGNALSIHLTSVDGESELGNTWHIREAFNPAVSTDNAVEVYATVTGVTPANILNTSITCVCSYDHGTQHCDAEFHRVGFLTTGGVYYNDNGDVTRVVATLHPTTITDDYVIFGKVVVNLMGAAGGTAISPETANLDVYSSFPSDYTVDTSGYVGEDDTHWYDGQSVEVQSGETLTIGTGVTIQPYLLQIDTGAVVTGGGTIALVNYQDGNLVHGQVLIYNGGECDCHTSGGFPVMVPEDLDTNQGGMSPDTPSPDTPSGVTIVGGDQSGLLNFQIRSEASVQSVSLPDAFVELAHSGQLAFSSTDPQVDALYGDVDSSVSGAGTLTVNGNGGAYCGEIADGDSALSLVVNGNQILLGTQSYTGSTTVNGTLGITGNVNSLVIGDGGTVQTVADTTLSSAFAIADDSAAVSSIDTNGFNVTLSATVAGTGQLRVTGGGTLNLTGSIAASTLIVDGGATAVVSDPASVPDGINLSIGDSDQLASLESSLLSRLTTSEGEDAPPPFDYARAHAIYEGRREVSVDVLMAEAAVFNPTNPDTTAAVMSAIGVDFSAAVAMLAANGGTRDGLTQAAVDSAMAGAWAAAGKTAVSNSNTWDGGVANPYDDQVISWRNLELEFMETHSVS